ncbi:MAG TPA: nuclear transport factor 2 family protein [Pyrinomonadaceae bacterium]|nr:nuclear transport factor 2 family protein [Pyrinomonadaceae bacterium]
MKKLISLLGLLVVVAAACTTEPPASNAPATNANSVTAGKNTAVSEADAIAREKATWEALKKKDTDAFASLLATEYLEIGGDGVFNKEGIVAYMKDLNLTDYSMSDVKMRQIDKDALLLTYDVIIKGTYKNEAFPTGPYHSGTAWVNRDGKWLAIYYQESLAVPAPPAAPPNKKEEPKPPAKAGASPAATIAALGPDPIANEKAVWDALKSKNYDAFASMLAPDFVEIEQNGIYDKAASVKGVQGFDASKTQFSDWKSVKFDNDAMLVTYTIMTPGAKPPSERHSTIWANRDGKWAAIYHQGSGVSAPAPPAKKTAAK